MKKLILLMIAAVALNSCVEPAKKIENKSAFLDQKLQNFIAAHPEWQQNEIIEKRVNAILIDSLNGWKKDKRFLDGLPLRLESINHVDENGKMIYFAAFVKGNFFVPEGYEGLPISINVLSVVDKADVEKLKTGVDYFINGDYIKTISNDGIGKIAGDYSLGTYRFKISSFKQY